MIKRRQTLWTWFLLTSTLVFLLICHLTTLSGPLFTVDDEILIKIPQLTPPLNFKSMESIFRWNQHIDYYPIRDLSYAFDVALWGDAVLPARIHQILLFWLSAVLMNFVLLELLVPWLIALLGTIAWAIHPYHIETIVWLSARKDLLAIVFGLLSVLFFLKALKLKKNTLWGCSLGAFIFGLLSKASITPLPWIAALRLLLGDRSSRTRSATITVLFALIVSGISALGQSWFYTNANDMRNFMPWGLRIQTSLTALGKMASGWFLPSINVIDLDTFGEWRAKNHSYVFVGIAAWISYAWCLAYAIWKRQSLYSIGIISIGILYLPISGLCFQHRTFYSTRYFEPSSLALWMILILNLRIQPSNRVLYAIGFTLGIIGTFSVLESSKWTDPLTIQLNALKQNPSSISLKSHTLNEIINSIRFESGTQRAPLILLRNQLKEELSTECNALIQSDLRTEENQLANCYVFFRTGYFLNRWNHHLNEADRYFHNFEKASSLLNPLPKMVHRMRFENMLLKNSIDLKFVENWLATNPYLLNSTYRILNFIGQCLLTSENKGSLVREAIANRLLSLYTIKLFMKDYTKSPMRTKMEACLEENSLKSEIHD